MIGNLDYDAKGIYLDLTHGALSLVDAELNLNAIKIDDIRFLNFKSYANKQDYSLGFTVINSSSSDDFDNAVFVDFTEEAFKEFILKCAAFYLADKESAHEKLEFTKAILKINGKD